MSPRPRRHSAPLASRMVRESTLVATRNEMRVGTLALLSPVMVIDNDKGFGVSLRTLDEVAAGDPVKVVAIPQSPEHAVAIAERAYSQIGAPYGLFGRNCEHFATWCVTGVPRSYQLYNYTAVAGVMSLGLVLTAWNAKFRRVPA